MPISSRSYVLALPLLLAAQAFSQSRPNQTLLRPGGMLKGETADVYVNGQIVGTLVQPKAIDISRYVRAGANRLTIKWAKPVSFVNATVAHAKETNRFATIGRVQMSTDPALKKAGSKTITFLVPGKSSGKTQGESKPAYGSLARQTILKVTQWVEPQTVEAFINGKSVGELGIKSVIDITDLVRPGRNTLKIVWAGKAEYIGVKVAYAKKPNVFGDAGEIRLISTPVLKKSGSKSLTFMVPKS